MDTTRKLGNLLVAKAIRNDARKLREIAISAGIDAWTELDYRDEIGRSDSTVLTISTDNEGIIGFLVSRMVPGLDAGIDSEIYNIAIREQFQRSGVGTALFRDLLGRLGKSEIKNIWLEVRESNERAIEFYTKHGFKAIATRRNFYSGPSENAIVMSRPAA